MNENRFPDYLDHMQQAAIDACGFVEGLSKADFLEGKRSQQAVIMSLIIGEAATKVMDGYVEVHAGAPASALAQHAWDAQPHSHGYFDINLDVVWGTVQAAPPEQPKQLLVAHQADDNEPIPSSSTKTS